MATSQGSAISAANRVKLRPLAANASRLVRLETGSSSEAVFDRWVQAYTCGLGRAPSRAAVANTTGVSSTTVASRLSTAVIAEASANTWTSSRRGRPAAARAIHGAAGVEQPLVVAQLRQDEHGREEPDHRSQPLASAAAWSREIAPVAMTRPAAGTATTASGQPHGRITAQASTATSRATDSASAIGAFRVGTFPGFVHRQRNCQRPCDSFKHTGQ